MARWDYHKLHTLYSGIYRETDGIYHSIAKHYGLSDCAFWILYTICESEKFYTQSELCDVIFLSKQTVNSALKKLEADGYIELKQTGNNRKNKQIRLTPLGEIFERENIESVFNMEQRAFECFLPQECDAFFMLNQKYVSQLREEANKILELSSEDL